MLSAVTTVGISIAGTLVVVAGVGFVVYHVKRQSIKNGRHDSHDPRAHYGDNDVDIPVAHVVPDKQSSQPHDGATVSVVAIPATALSLPPGMELRGTVGNNWIKNRRQFVQHKETTVSEVIRRASVDLCGVAEGSLSDDESI